MMNAEVRIAPELRQEERPRSAVSSGVGLAGMAGLIAWTCVSRAYGFSGPNAALCSVLACGVPMILWSLLVDKVHRSPTTGIDWDSPPRSLRESLDVSIVKLAGLWATWAAIGFLYWVARWYWDGNYLFSMKVFGYSAGPLLLLSIPYIAWLDRRLREPRDGAWHFGQVVIGRSALADRDRIHEHLRAWTVKAFFLAFMIAIVPGNWAETINPSSDFIVSNIVNLSGWLVAFLFMIDVTYATVGYVLTMKPLDSHIRSANPYAAGWMAALICYPPFILMNDGGPLDYHVATAGNNAWAYWFDGYPLLMALWGFLLVLLTGLYAWATVAFGPRFSNLTHRGILTHGPYAWSKHPAYLAKNLFWWLCLLPFLVTNGNVADMVRNFVLMAAVSGVYYWRARTEERHLSADPAYRAYSEWMDRHGPIARLLRKLSINRRPHPLPAE
ncbi:MAG: protein-S-isoprenylcysteine methyltransferase [Alphaproteobacteria bacterium]|nr:protein-S-isoprenylcysteine methyltransferase [Alphaproteobacteria bacterium]